VQKSSPGELFCTQFGGVAVGVLVTVLVVMAGLLLPGCDDSGDGDGDGSGGPTAGLTAPPLDGTGTGTGATVPGLEPGASATVATVAGSGPGCRPAASRSGTGPAASPYNGLGTWVDVFDYSPAYAEEQVPAITPDHIPQMAALGVTTVYLQPVRNDEKGITGIVEPELVTQFLQRAHSFGMCVVAWYLPRFSDPEVDFARLETLRTFEPVPGERFDSIALDIEFRGDVADHTLRSQRLVELSARLRAANPGMLLGAIVPPPVLMEVINDDFWAGFPWTGIAPFYDVWLPMTYWTFRNSDSPYRDAFTYTDESIRRMRANLGLPDAVVHPIGGIGDTSSNVDYVKFVQAASLNQSVGISVYDYRTTASYAWLLLDGQP
jgi:hypothetical protein